MSNKEAVIVIAQDEVLTLARAELKAAEERVEERQKFINKQVKDARDDFEKANKLFWEKSEARLQEMGLTKAGDCLSISPENVILRRVGEDDDNPLSKIFGHMFKL